MNITVQSPQHPREFRPRRQPRSQELLQALAANPPGWWLRVSLESIEGANITAKQNTTARAARRYFKRSVQVMIESGNLYIRQIPGKYEMFEAMPVNRTHRPRQVFYPPTNDHQLPVEGRHRNPDRVAVA
jgi:hypothetical protein